MRIGSHVSSAGKIFLAIDRAGAIGCQSIQMFIGNPRSWRPPKLSENDIAEFVKRRKKSGIDPVAVHLPYLVNLCSPKDDLQTKSIDAVLEYLKWADLIGADFIVTHFGSHLGKGEEVALKRIKQSLKAILKSSSNRVKLLLENTAGAGYSMGYKMRDFEDVFKYFDNDERIGLCLDTAHAFSAGYDISSKAGLNSFLNELDSLIGLEKLYFIHLNDSRSEFDSRKDRHEHIGKGSIGIDGFKNLVNHPKLAEVGAVIETPKKNPEDDGENLSKLFSLVKI